MGRLLSTTTSTISLRVDCRKSEHPGSSGRASASRTREMERARRMAGASGWNGDADGARTPNGSAPLRRWRELGRGGLAGRVAFLLRLRLGEEERAERLQQLLAPVALRRGEGDGLVGVDLQLLHRLLERLRALGLRELVGLGEREEHGDAELRQVVDGAEVLGGGAGAQVDELDDARQLPALREVAVDQRLPAVAQLLGHPGVAVAGEVDQAEVAGVGAHVVEVDLLRLPRLLADAGDGRARAPQQAGDEGRLADVGAAGGR